MRYQTPPLACYVVDDYGNLLTISPSNTYKAALYYYGIAQMGVHLMH